jgi:hypothetical protein
MIYFPFVYLNRANNHRNLNKAFMRHNNSVCKMQYEVFGGFYLIFYVSDVKTIIILVFEIKFK